MRGHIAHGKLGGSGELKWCVSQRGELRWRSALAEHEDFAPFIAEAVKLEPEFVAHVKKAGGAKLTGDPRLWITTTEVA